MESRIRYWLAEHPAIVGFRWSHAQSWGSTWSFLVAFLAAYALLALVLHLLLRLRRRPLPLGPLPALHSLAMALASAAIFLGLLLSAAAEIRDTRWSWLGRNRSTPIQWLLCFPLGTRPSGRVFFWSYAFYLSRFLHLLRTFLNILQHRPRAALAGVVRHSALVCMSFLWLEFSQSFQVVAILSATLAQAVVFGYRFWVGVGLPAAARSGAVLVVACKVALTGCNFVCHLGVLLLHFAKGGCNGIGAWVFNSVLDAALLLLFINFRAKPEGKGRKGESLEDNTGRSDHRRHHHHHHRRHNAVDSTETKKEQ